MKDVAVYKSEKIEVFEWPQPCCEIYCLKTKVGVAIRDKQDAVAVIESLTRFIEAL